MARVALSRLESGLAAQLLAGVERFHPRGPGAMQAADLRELCEQGLCFGAEVEGGQVVYVLHVKNGHVRVMAAKGAASVDLTRTVLPVIEAQCADYRTLAFETARRGLVAKTEAMGYQARGWTMVKDLQQ